ncbi:MAG: tripartite tricarboxylate transporter substrate-binding protein [Rhodoferax sp.]|nr:tripartite tricarboxylate transporter substrate-binding protein [Rhodoferax sp.]
MATSAAALSIHGIARASAWAPNGVITYNIGVAPGGSVDLYARGIQKSLEALNLVGGHSVIPQNRPGAAGLLALQALQKYKGDGHQLGTFHTGSIAGQVTGVLKADIREFVPVAMMVEETTLVAVAQSSTLKGVQDLVAQLQRDPASLKIAVAPLRGLNLHLAIAKPLKLAGIDVSKLTVAPFRSSGESMAALLGGHVDVAVATGPTVVPMAQAGKIRMLVSCSASRDTGPLAEVMTWREFGIAADYVSYNGVLLAPGVDADQIRFWETALSKVAASSEWRQLVERSGNKPIFKGFSDSRRYLENEMKETQALVSSLGGVAR